MEVGATTGDRDAQHVAGRAWHPAGAAAPAARADAIAWTAGSFASTSGVWLFLLTILTVCGERGIPPIAAAEAAVLHSEAVAAPEVARHTHLLSEIELGWTPLAAVFLLAQLPLVLVLFVQAHRRRVEHARRLVDDPMDLAAAFADIGFWRWDADSDRLSVTEHSRKLIGLETAEELTATSFLESVHPEDRPVIQASADRALREDCAYAAEYRVLLPNGATRWIAARGRAIRSRSRHAVGLAGIAFDITQQKTAALESERRQQDLVHLTRVATLGGLSGAMAHEINQPLTAILSNAQAAQQLLARQPIDTVELAEILADIVTDDNRAGAVIRHLRTLLRKDEPTMRPQDVSVLVREVAELAHSEFVERRIAVATHLANDLPPVLGDRVQLQQIVLNLILNACEALEALRQSPRRILISTECRDRRWVQISVSDNGGGISEEMLGRIFEPFLTTKPHGLGLGLSICRSIANAHGGTLRAANNPTGGATLRLRLPVNTGSES